MQVLFFLKKAIEGGIAVVYSNSLLDPVLKSQQVGTEKSTGGHC